MSWAAVIGWAGFAFAGVAVAYFAYHMKAADAARKEANKAMRVLSDLHESYRSRTEKQIGVLNDKINQLQKIAVDNLDPDGQRELLGSLLQAPDRSSSHDD